jgi:hypothetical protein
MQAFVLLSAAIVYVDLRRQCAARLPTQTSAQPAPAPATHDRKWSTVPQHRHLTQWAMQRAVFALLTPGVAPRARDGTSQSDRWTAALRVHVCDSGAQRCDAMLVGQFSRFAVACYQLLSYHQSPDQIREPAAQADDQDSLCVPRIADLSCPLPRTDTTPTLISRYRIPRPRDFRRPPRKGHQLQRSMPLPGPPRRQRA